MHAEKINNFVKLKDFIILLLYINNTEIRNQKIIMYNELNFVGLYLCELYIILGEFSVVWFIRYV